MFYMYIYKISIPSTINIYVTLLMLGDFLKLQFWALNDFIQVLF